MKVALIKYIVILFFIIVSSGSLLAQNNSKPYSKDLESVELKLREGNFQAAIEILDGILIKYPNAHDIYYAKGLLFGQVGSVDNAILNVEQAYRLDPSFTYANYLVDLYKSQKNWSKAIEVLYSMYSKFPTEPAIARELIATLGVNDRFEEALIIYNGEKAKGLHSDTLDVSLADVYFHKKEFKKGIELLEGWKNTSKFSGYFGRLGFGYIEDGKVKSGIAILEDGLTKTNDPALYLDLAEAYNLEGKTKLSFDYLKKAFESDQLDYGHKYRIMVDVLNPKNKTFTIDQTYTLANTLVLVNPRIAESHMLKGEVLWKKGNLAEARSVFLTAVGIAPNQVDAWRMLINLDLADNQPDIAIRHSREALTANPGNPMLLYFAGLSFSAKNDTEMARQMLEAALDNSTNENNYLQSVIYGSLGDLYHKLNMDAASDVAYEEAIRLDSTNSTAMNNLAYYLSVRKQDLDKAATYSLRSINLEPKLATFQDTYAWILFQQGNYDEALKWIEKAIKNSSTPSSVVVEHYGDILIQNGKIKQAVKQWEKAMLLSDFDQNHKSRLETKIKQKKYVE